MRVHDGGSELTSDSPASCIASKSAAWLGFVAVHFLFAAFRE
ncbi:hypothetical protein CAter10_3043 [Collimonas arenae]|nr:hypothetical protein CAter10_3043 [Collimonas arenae]